MIATLNYPGSSNFRWFHGTKQECVKWVDENFDHSRGFAPYQIFSDKKAKRMRWRDGTHIFPQFRREMEKSQAVQNACDQAQKD